MAANQSGKFTHFSGIDTTLFKVNGIQQKLGGYESVTAGKTLVAADNGMTLFLGDAASGDITLPAVTNTGFAVKVICGFTITTASAVISAEGDNISGTLVVAGAAVPAVAEDQINFIGSAALAGDYIEITSDGTNWLVHGIGNGSGSITATDPA